ncbi:hypothetical protein A1O7_01119 [Cladophialophora yegresii CBS 114405]|uniref:RING-type E3 ubiquitin transferase n=1 Tax=Cladophialophora yegresii CBS 114405 TaxID=1182544 RepID=W9WJI9_9EURO|nr:uncharacterized protein A1O7_01119 [Cladophialophora yegresii CBS 114405]EXJ64781.1 hypothetical protein A1O7_01119 [Cladophialophora yegresii CBS 114405]
MSRIQGERVFCHQCQNEWDRAHGGLICPRCEGDFTEILEPGALPSTYDFNHEPSPSASPEPPLPPLEPLRDHNPWADTTRTDDDGNFTTFEFTSNGGSGRMMFSTRMWSPDGRNVRLDDLLDSAVEDVEMEELLTHLVEQQNRGGPLPFSPLGFPGAEAGPGLHGPPPHMQPASLQDLFSLILQSMQPGMMPGQDPDDRRRLGQPPLPFDLLHHMLNPGNARTGDAVYSQEAFDRIMTQLMEQNNAGSAPPPASEDAIRSLKKKRVDREMLGDDGKAECSICMDNVDVGQEVTVLPCNHWFHGECVISWLKEHDTCPHCRKPITNSEEGRRPEPSRRRSRRASSVSSPRAYQPEGSRYNPIPVPESPSALRDARQQYYGRRRDYESHRPEHHRHSSSQSDLRRHSSRSHHGGNGGSRGGGGNSGGGVTGWIRDHLPFS